ncbi:MAG: AMP-dependent synthetase, partial [Actinomyces sp.]
RGPAREAQIRALAPGVVVDEHGTTRLEGGRPVAEGDALVVTTSGTTGEPRAVVSTHEAVAAAARATSAALDVDPERDRWLACLPLAHVGGLSVVTRALITGTPLEVHDGVDLERLHDARRRGATLVSLVPTVVARTDVSGFRRVLLGGSAIPADRPANCVATYGMTETGGGVVYDGRPLAGVEVAVVDGEIRLRCPMLARADRDGRPLVDADGWFHTGDGGALVDGVLSVHGRLAEVIVTGGEKVWPDPVEKVLAEHPGVSEVAVVGRPDPEWGEVVTAVVVPADSASPPRLDELRDLVRSRLAPWCAPRRLELRSSLPRTALGKIRRHLL